MEKSKENIKKLAEAIVCSSWDLETRTHFCISMMEQAYEDDTALFNRDWNRMSKSGDV